MKAFFGSIEDLTLKNSNFRQVLFTGQHCQLVVMCLEPGEEIGREMHDAVDQFFRLERGEAKFILNDTDEHIARATDAVVIPAGTYHNVVNNSATQQLKLYTLYSPPNHPEGTIHRTKAEADAAGSHAKH